MRGCEWDAVVVEFEEAREVKEVALGCFGAEVAEESGSEGRVGMRREVSWKGKKGAWGTSEVSSTLQGDVGVSRRVSGSQQRVKRAQGGMMEVLAVCISRSEI